jgi:hypothetical protein
MREKIIFIDFVIMIILWFLIILDLILTQLKINIFFYINFMYLLIILFFYLIIKSILGIILFIKNIIQDNILILTKKTLILFIPSFLLLIYIVYFSLSHLSSLYHLQKAIVSIIFSIGCLTLLSYYILNKTLFIKIYIKIVMAIMLPITYFVVCFLIWVF